MRIGIALGSNLGDRRAHLAAGRDFVFSLQEGSGSPLCSGLYETEPVECAPGTDSFLNAVVEIETQLSPAEVLARLRAYERPAGRAENHARNSPRGIDLDLLYAGDARIDAPEMTLPHPRMISRRFVLQPLADIRPDLVIPGEKNTVSWLLANLPAAPAVRLVEDRW